jgi:carbon storage regulator
MIGENIKITVVEIGEDQIRLGIEAPREITIYREEVYEKIRGENIRASQMLSLDSLGKAGELLKTKKKEPVKAGDIVQP